MRDICHLFAIGAVREVVDRTASLRFGVAVHSTGIEQLDFFAGAACAFVAFSVLDGDVSAAEIERLQTVAFTAPTQMPAGSMTASASFAALWSRHGLNAVKECSEHVQAAFANATGSRGREMLADAIGGWIMSAVYNQAAPSTFVKNADAGTIAKWERADQQCRQSLGHLIASTFVGYWAGISRHTQS